MGMREGLALFFQAVDRDGSGYLTIDNVEKAITQRDSQAYLRAMGVDVTDAWTLLRLLDGNGNGTVDREEFIQGCMILRCEAKAVHIATLAYDQRNKLDLLEVGLKRANYQLNALVRTGFGKVDHAA